MMIKGNDEIEEYEHIFYISVESSLRMLSLETFLSFEYVQSRVQLPYSGNNCVYTPGTTYEMVLDACREHYLQKYPYKDPVVIPNIILGELTSIWFRRRIDDPEEDTERQVDDYFDWTYLDTLVDEDYDSGGDNW